MSTNATHDATEPSAEHGNKNDIEDTGEEDPDAESQGYPAVRAMSSPSEQRTREKNPPDLSGGHRHVREVLDVDTGHPHEDADPDEVTSS